MKHFVRVTAATTGTSTTVPLGHDDTTPLPADVPDRPFASTALRSPFAASSDHSEGFTCLADVLIRALVALGLEPSVAAAGQHSSQYCLIGPSGAVVPPVVMAVNDVAKISAAVRPGDACFLQQWAKLERRIDSHTTLWGNAPTAVAAPRKTVIVTPSTTPAEPPTTAEKVTDNLINLGEALKDPNGESSALPKGLKTPGQKPSTAVPSHMTPLKSPFVKPTPASRRGRDGQSLATSSGLSQSEWRRVSTAAAHLRDADEAEYKSLLCPSTGQLPLVPLRLECCSCVVSEAAVPGLERRLEKRRRGDDGADVSGMEKCPACGDPDFDAETDCFVDEVAAAAIKDFAHRALPHLFELDTAKTGRRSQGPHHSVGRSSH